MERDEEIEAYKLELEHAHSVIRDLTSQYSELRDATEALLDIRDRTAISFSTTTDGRSIRDFKHDPQKEIMTKAKRLKRRAVAEKARDIQAIMIRHTRSNRR